MRQNIGKLTQLVEWLLHTQYVAGSNPAFTTNYMAKTFSNIKKSLGLLDVIQFGKYKNCRVDSVIEQDDEYLRFMQTQGIKFDAAVMDALTNKFSATSIAVNSADDAAYDDPVVDELFDDIPF